MIRGVGPHEWPRRSVEVVQKQQEGLSVVGILQYTADFEGRTHVSSKNSCEVQIVKIGVVWVK